MKPLNRTGGLWLSGRRRHRGLFSLRVTVFLLGTALGAAALDPGQFRFDYDNGVCTLEANGARLPDVLAAIQEKTGIPIQYDKDDPGITTQSMKNVDLERLMRALAENVVMTFVVDDTSPQGYRMVRVEFSAAADETAKARAQAITRQASAPAQPATRTVPVRYSGVGAQMSYSSDRKGLHFTAVTENAPITRAGITPEDVVLAVDDKLVSSFRSLSDLSKLIRGKEGTTVKMTVRKPNGALVRVNVVRANLVYEATVPKP